MTIAVLTDLPGVTQEQYDATSREINPDRTQPPGGLAHLAGPYEMGMRIVEVWESQEAPDAFRRDKVAPVMQRFGMQPPPMHVWPLHAVLMTAQGI